MTLQYYFYRGDYTTLLNTLPKDTEIFRCIPTYPIDGGKDKIFLHIVSGGSELKFCSSFLFHAADGEHITYLSFTAELFVNLKEFTQDINKIRSIEHLIQSYPIHRNCNAYQKLQTILAYESW